MRRSGDRGQSAPLGVALLLGLTILGTTAVVAFGSVALTDTQSQSELARSEQAMTLFDSQAAQVALGDSSVQTVDFGSGEGTYSVDPDAGKISIVQLNCDDSDDPIDYDNVTDSLGSNGTGVSNDTYLLKPTDLGKVTYETNDGTLAYQGGGVWKQSKSGGIGMVSPPEFHYRGATLTFPLILTRGSGGASGSARATVTAPNDPTKVFADPKKQYPSRCWNGTDSEQFTNPVTNGSVVVRIESEYAKGWGRYFETRTEGIITYPADDVVLIELISLGQIGDFDMPGDGGSITVSGAAGGHATSEFTIRLRPDDTDSANFNNLEWSMYVEEGDQQFEISLKKSGSGGCDESGNTGITADLSVYYSNDGGDTYQGWKQSDAFDAECEDLNDDGDNEIYMDIEFVDDKDGQNDFVDIESGDANLTYQSLSQSDLTAFSPGDFNESTTFSGHDDWESGGVTYDSADSDSETIDRLVNHYFAELPDEFALTVDDKDSDTINEAGSSGRLITGGSARYVTYLHVTENEVDIQIDDD